MTERIVKNSIVNMCKKSTDELFHYTLYQWWLDEGLEKELLSVESPFLEKFLKYAPPSSSSPLTIPILFIPSRS